VLNADQAMPMGGNVSIKARNCSSSDAALPHELARQDTVLIVIQDTGVGIPEHYLGKIYDPYFTTKEKGSGLGLATSYSIIKNHGGAIQVRSAVGKGTIFSLYLPASVASGEKVPPPAARTGQRKGRILLMDDEEMIRMVAKEMLGELGHDVVFANNGEAAIEAYCASREAGTPFDVVILDLTIRGGMGGEETMAKLRAIDATVKAVVSSGYSDDAALATHKAQGFMAFLKKPYNLMELQQTLDLLLK
jgi:two-component system cell cycle sensor histidine kinase/response regulator CckA